MNYQHVGEDMMDFRSLQEGYWWPDPPGRLEIKLIAYGGYLEFSFNQRVPLSLADQTYQSGLLGIYVESAKLILEQSVIHRLETRKATTRCRSAHYGESAKRHIILPIQ